ncbi:MAG: YicC/YloC family endoribonuclease, partial [Thermodesulfobacteriota bacterium]|nr:YicC/YloC family endoribonuclease [Thermodesulfobacteriota bacterium]
MTRSMTGYSSISGTHDLFNFLIQIRSENSKSLEISIIDDLNNFKLQEKIKKIIRKDFSRGKIRIVISCKPDQKFVKSKNIEKVLSDFTNLTKERGLVPTISLLELREIINTESTKMQSNLK